MLQEPDPITPLYGGRVLLSRTRVVVFFLGGRGGGVLVAMLCVR